MIERIEIAGCASYGDTVEIMGGLSTFNYVYGPNASGKTTISRLIADHSPFSACAVHWRAGTKLETLVYNRDFVDANFNQPAGLKGIFTLGEKDVDAASKIALAKSEINDLSQKIESDTNTLEGLDRTGGKRGELTSIETAFKDECWDLKKKHDAKLQGALTGFRNDAQKFKDKLISECLKNPSQSLSQAELEQKAESVFGPSPSTEPTQSLISDTAFLAWENNAILKKRILGKTDVDIADMIQKLGNSDWVKQGVPYYEANDDQCPFCQQTAPGTLAASLKKYFDETFLRDSASIDALKTGYKLEGERIQQTMQATIDANSRFLDVEKLKAEKSIFDSRLQLNLQRIESKRKEPSQLIDLEPLTEVLATSKQLIADANQKIQAHNLMVTNLAVEKQTLTNQVWEFFAIVEIKSKIAAYQLKKANVEKAIKALELKINTTNGEKATKEKEIQRLEKSTTSIKPTVNEINKILKGFGFDNFSLAATATGNLYTIRRPDGTDAQATLSEGERSFITFLYFYHLLKGSESSSGMTNDRVVVFDDPVSSLDSDVLFIVSSLIRQTIEDARAKKGHIKQVFVLTHNIYFHKEITFDKNRSAGVAQKDESFWTIRKLKGVSKVQNHKTNPITSSYEMLWSEVKERNLASQTIQNTLRRILEYYFKILGGMSFDEITERFDGEEKLICKSLLTWVNVGSHFIQDDVFAALDESTVEKYLDVFRKIFIKTQHLNHYNMMMGESYVIEATSVPVG